MVAISPRDIRTASARQVPIAAVPATPMAVITKAGVVVQRPAVEYVLRRFRDDTPSRSRLQRVLKKCKGDKDMSNAFVATRLWARRERLELVDLVARRTESHGHSLSRRKAHWLLWARQRIVELAPFC